MPLLGEALGPAGEGPRLGAGHPQLGDAVDQPEEQARDLALEAEDLALVAELQPDQPRVTPIEQEHQPGREKASRQL